MGEDQKTKLLLMNGYLSTDKAAAYLDTGTKTIYRYRKAGILQGKKLGKEWKYKIEDLERLIKKSS